MKSLYVRIYLTMVVVLLLFAALSGWMFQRQIEQERGRAESMLSERMSAWAELIQRSLPGPDESTDSQASELREWSQRLRLPLALDSAAGLRIASSESFLRRQSEGARSIAIKLEDGRTLWVMRPGRGQGGRMGRSDGSGAGDGRGGGPPVLPFLPPGWQRGFGLIAVLVVLFIAVAAGAYPVVRRLTRRLEALKRGVEQFGEGQLGHRVAISGHDEVAAVAASFNTAAERVETLVRSHRSLLANASHELRSPLARMKMAVSMLDEATPAQREKLKREIDTNVAELDALVEEVLLASRLEATTGPSHPEPIDLLGLAVEEGARVQAVVEGGPASVVGDERLVRRALRNLLENARRYGGAEIAVSIVAKPGDGGATLSVCDRGPGVPEAMRDRIFEPFFRMPGHAEQAGGVGLGLSLVKQIAERHGGRVRCEARNGGGSCFVLDLPARPPAAAAIASPSAATPHVMRPT
jgi:signal transduction histidine kinase